MASVRKFFWESWTTLTNFEMSDSLTQQLCKKYLYHVGFWPADNEPKGFVLIMRNTLMPYLRFANLYALFIGYPMLTYLYKDEDPQRSLYSAANVFVDSSYLVIYSSLIYKRKQISAMFDALEAMRVCSKKLPKRPKEVLERNSRWSRGPLVYLLVCLAGIFLNFSDIPNLYKRRGFVYDQWYPFDAKESPTFQIVFVITALSAPWSITCLLTFTALFMSLLVEAIGQFRLLSYNLRHIQGGVNNASVPLPSESTEELVDGPTVVAISSEDLTERGNSFNLYDSLYVGRKRQIEETMKICVKQHYAILRFVKEVTSFYNRFLFCVLLGALLPNSLGIVLLIYAKEMKTHVSIVFVMMAGSNAAIIICCWLSDLITKESEAVREAVYDCDWFGQSESFKRSMRIIMSLSNQPVVIRVDGFIAMSMETYYAMSKITYSYCTAVLTQYEEAYKYQEDFPEGSN